MKTKRLSRKEVGKWIAFERGLAGMTQIELAQSIGVTQDYISHVECGRRYPSLPIFLLIAKELKMDIYNV